MTTSTRRLLTAGLLVAAAQAGVRTQEPAASSRPARAASQTTPVATPRTTTVATPHPTSHPASHPTTLALDDQRRLVQQYCVGCHSDAAKAGGLSLAGFDPSRVVENAAVTEKMIRKLRAGMMPPAATTRRPDAETVNAFVTTLESAVDESAAKRPNAGHRTFQRLNRAEYARSIHDLLALDVDVEAFLPSDTISSGFDNIADVQSLSPTLMEGYLRAASSVARIAVGDPKVAPSPTTYHVSRTEGQMRHVEGAPIGTRGGLSIVHTFPADGDYVLKLTFFDGGTGELFGGTTITSTDVGEQAEISVEGTRVGVFTLSGWMDESDPQGLSVSTPPIHIQAGPRRVSAAFIQRYAGPNDDLVAPIEITDANPRIGIVYGVTALPHVRDLTIAGPTNITGISATPSRRKIFSCRPATGREDACAFEIIRRLATGAFREPVGAAEFEILRGLYSHEREKNGFEAGIRLALQGILASPRFLFRFEAPPAVAAKDGQPARISNLALASRLSFFLWGSAPDAALLAAATEGRLDKPAVLEQQVRRMLADPRRTALSTRFASLWLRLQDVEKVNPVALHYPDYDHYLSESLVRETELFFDNIVKEDRSVLDLLTADYSFINERIARLYGIPNVIGSDFRRVALPPERRGLLGQGSVLMQTSVADRTSPVQRGKWIMEVLLGSPPPPPPPNVPAFEETKETGNGRILTVRERMEQHRANPVCASCHRVIDPPGLALENFDVTGKWRIKDQGTLIDSAGQLYDGTKMEGPMGLRDALLKHSDLVLLSFTENLMTYALGRRVEYYDMPRVRAIARDAGVKGNHLSAFILGIVKSPAFQMQSAPAPASAGLAALPGDPSSVIASKR